jgi:tetratricopeptide (TPR) repeat protein
MICLLLAAAWASRLPEDYELTLRRRAAADMSRISASGDLDRTRRYLDSWSKAMAPDASLLYELGLSLNQAGRLEGAVQVYSEALLIDPGLLEARYDRAELLILLGEPDKAAIDLQEAIRLGGTHWAIHLRLSEVAASKGEPEAFGQAILRAFQEGAPPSLLLDMGDRWRSWARDPLLGEPLRRAILLYGKEEVWLRLYSE